MGCLVVGALVGVSVGVNVGLDEGRSVGVKVGRGDGGLGEGRGEGLADGEKLGRGVGRAVGLHVGTNACVAPVTTIVPVHDPEPARQPSSNVYTPQRGKAENVKDAPPPQLFADVEAVS